MDATAAHQAIDDMVAAHNAEVAALNERIAELTPPPSVTPSSLVDGEDVVINGARYRAQLPDRAYAGAAVVDPDTPTYFRGELREGDRWSNDIASFPNDNRQRAEMRNLANLPTQVAVWFANSFRISQEGGWKPGGYNILRQFHSQGRGSPSVALSIVDGRLRAYTQGSLAGASSADTHPNAVIHYNEPFVEDVWHQLVGCVVFSQGTANGKLDLWLDGDKIVTKTGLVNGYNGTSPYEKLGLYRSGWTGTIVSEVANPEIGTSTLFDRVASPLPLPTYVQ